MIKIHFGDKLNRVKSSERAEAMPAAIITAIVSALLLLGIAGTVALVVESKADSENNVQMTTAVSNIDVSLRSDVTNASYISASAKVKQPAGHLLTPTDVTVSGVNMHIPDTNGGCKVVRWSAYANTVSRDLTTYSLSSNKSGTVTCDESSEKLAERKKVFADNVNISAPFAFTNQVGRSIVFNHADASLGIVNAQLDAKLKSLNVQRLSDADFNELNKLLKSDSFVASFANPAACPMNAPRGADGACPVAESDTIVAAWDSLKIAKVAVDFSMDSSVGEKVTRNIEQNSSVPLYRNAAEAEAAVAGVARGNRPAATVASISATKVTLGQNYTINWTSNNSNKCPANTTQAFNVYENGRLVKSTTATSFTKAHTVSSDEYVEYTVQVECVRGALLVTSDLSNAVKAKVIPAAPAITINSQPAAEKAPLNSSIDSVATCLYGTTPRYNFVQVSTTHGTAGQATNLASGKQAINANKLTVVEGARYEYRVEAWCESLFDKSPTNTKTTSPFVTVTNKPTVAAAFTAPAANATDVATNAAVTWSAAKCATGTTPKYYTTKNINGNKTITAEVIDNWTGDLKLTSANTQGNIVGYTLASRCEGTAPDSDEVNGKVAGAPSATTTLKYTTMIAAPAAPKFTAPTANATGVATNVTVKWNAVTCATGTTAKYYLYKNVDKGANITAQVLVNWTTDTSAATNNSQGNSVGYIVKARCDGLNLNSSEVSSTALQYTTMITSPVAPKFTSPASDATGIAVNAKLTWGAVTCPTGTTTKYYVNKYIEKGITHIYTVYPENLVITNWTTGVSVATANTQGNKVGYMVKARCDGPNASSAESASSLVDYTTTIAAPAAPKFTAPAANATGVAATTALKWGAVTCATETAPKYFVSKTMDKGANITAQTVANWVTTATANVTNKQGYKVAYTVKARCDGPNANSSATAANSVTFITKVNAPTAPTKIHNDGGNWVGWEGPATNCAAEAPIQYRLVHLKQDNSAVNASTAWGYYASAALPLGSAPGWPQWATVEAYCKGAQADSTVTRGATTKWVKNFNASFSASMAWRRLNVWGSCPAYTSVREMYLYVAADGWGGPRYSNNQIQTDQGHWIWGAGPGGGGNSGWVQLNRTQNTQYINSTASWGASGYAGWGARISGNNMEGTYWNATAWGDYQYWWYGSCQTNFAIAYNKGWGAGGNIRNMGDPWSRYNSQPNGMTLTTAGKNAIK